VTAAICLFVLIFKLTNKMTALAVLGTAERNEALAHALHGLRAVIDADNTGFDASIRRIGRPSDLLTEDLSSWLQTRHARPLPG
jgi:hypothetical protein